jgi:hypothetical protein
MEIGKITRMPCTVKTFRVIFILIIALKMVVIHRPHSHSIGEAISDDEDVYDDLESAFRNAVQKL